MSIYIKPVVAFKKLESAKILKQNVYIYGATGFGKTELIRQFFKKDKYLYLPCSQGGCDLSVIPASHARCLTVVIDNINTIENPELQSQITGLCRDKSLWLILLGRSRMPSWLFDTFITCDMALISESDIALTEEGIDKYMRSEGIMLTKEQLHFQYKCSAGNLFGVKYTAQELLSGGTFGKELFERNSIAFQNYLESKIISELDTEIVDLLLRLSIVDDFTEDLAAMLTGDYAVSKTMERAMNAGNFLKKTDDVYTIRHHMINALRRKAARELSEGDLRHNAILAGGYYESRGEDDKALKLYAEYHEADRIRDLLLKNSRRNPENGYFIEMRKYYFMLSEKDIKSNVYLMSSMSMLYSLLLDFEKSEYWYQELKSYKNKVKGSKQREALCQLAYLDIALPGRGSCNILQIIKDSYTLLTNRSVHVPEFSVTSNLPSLMNGGKDFCEWSRHDREIAATAGALLSAFLGSYGKGLVSAALAESFYEKGGEPYEIISLVSKAKIEAASGGKTELVFAVTAILIRQYISQGNMENAQDLLQAFEQTAHHEGLVRLYPNIDALKCRLALYSGDKAGVMDWLNTAPDENQEFIALDRYRYLTKLLCYLAGEKYDSAYALIQSLKYYADHCDRTYLSMELELFTAIVLYRKGHEWKSTFLQALETISEYRFIPIISEKGVAVYELLKNSLESCQSDRKINQDWLKRVLEETGKFSRHYPNYLKAAAKECPKLQPMDIRILTCLADGLSIQETAGQLKINYETLRSRIKEIYRKLNVKNKTEAVMLAHEYHLL